MKARFRHILCGAIILGIITFGSNPVSADEKAPDGFLDFIEKITPMQVSRLTSCTLQGRSYLFYTKMHPFSTMLREDSGDLSKNPQTFFTSYSEKSRWSPEKRLDTPIYNVVSNGNQIVLLGDEGYQLFKDGRWSKPYIIPEFSNGFACNAPDGVRILYTHPDDLDLACRTFNGKDLSPEVILQEEWEYNSGYSSLYNKTYTRAVYAFNKLWLFYITVNDDKISRLYAQTWDGQEWSDPNYVITATQFSVVVHHGRIHLIYTDWQPDDPENIGSFFSKMNKSFHMRFDGRTWNDPSPLRTGQVMSIEALAGSDRLWFFTSDSQSIRVMQYKNGRWTRARHVKSPITNPFFTPRWLAIQAGIYLLFAFLCALLVWAISQLIEKHHSAPQPMIWTHASLFRRYVAYLFDTLFFAGAWWLYYHQITTLQEHLSIEPIFLYFTAWFGMLLFRISYYTLLEGIWGKTLGKWIAGVRVIAKDGGPCGLKRAFLRTVLRIIDGIMGYLVGAIIFGTSGVHQRLGDKLGKTLVIVDRKHHSIISEKQSTISTE